ncbi:MAG: carboxy-S-adenosyl-L-methionine synthase CmoA [Campylobacteraceae bacterium]|nr:carboxy-S-adenosyl-L-methionine synthase CmoA [Campylobacteraceae bacterium]
MDKVFEKHIEKQFEFDAKVASVFDDMLDRSIPFYSKVIDLICDVINSYAKDGSIVVDLGCSTANTLLALNSKVDKKLTLLGFDNSNAMLVQAQKKIGAYGADIKLENANILELDIPRSDIIIANYMLQFVRPMQRAELIKNIYNNLSDNGIFILSEKIIFEDKKLNKNMIDIYYAFKKSQGYSEFEISQKREALENVLVPYSEDENKKMVLNAKFKNIETIFKWGNFVTFLAKK